MKTSDTGLSLIKEFEGLRLTSYYCSSEELTVGYGKTGPEVYEGMTITKSQAETFLLEDVTYFEKAVNDLVDVDLTQNEFDSLVSFSFNCGVSSLKESTLLRRLNANEEKNCVFREELPKWINGNDGPVPGLIRRRAAELELAITEQGDLDSTFIENAIKYYQGLSHQTKAFVDLWEASSEEDRNVFVKTYRDQPKGKPALIAKQSKKLFPLGVPYFYQHDSETAHGGRMCFTSSMAMALDYIDPEKIDGDDDWYLSIVLYYGDTVSSEAQIKAAKSLGFDAKFKMDGREEDLCDLLDNGIPVPIGILHHGHIDSGPSGGGHWICLIGYDETYFYVHDPAGELDLIDGGYSSSFSSGKNLRYTRKNLMKRWLISNNYDGWYVDLSYFR